MRLRISLQCTHCGICAAICPSGAFTRRRRRILFDATQCRACDDNPPPLCAESCPAGAIQPEPAQATTHEKEPKP